MQRHISSSYIIATELWCVHYQNILHHKLHPHHFINSTWHRTSNPTSRNFTPCTVQEGEIGWQEVIQTFNTKRWTSLRTVELVNNLNSISWHFIKIDSFQDPSSDYFSKMSEIDSFQDTCVLHWNWLLSRPQCFTSESTHFKTHAVNYTSTSSKLTPFKTLILDYIASSISMGDYLQIDSI